MQHPSTPDRQLRDALNAFLSERGRLTSHANQERTTDLQG